MPTAPWRHNAVAIAVAFGWIAFGLAVAIASWRMDRLAHLRISPYSIPGLVPGILGMLMVVFGSVLLARAKAASRAAANGAGASTQDRIDAPPGTRRNREGSMNALAAAVLCVIFAAGFLGRGLPFTATAAGFILIFVMWFNWRESATGTFATGGLTRSILQAAAVALGAAFIIAWLFADVFLVRLP